MLRKRLAVVGATLLSFVAVSSDAFSQMPDPTIAAQAPVPGSGHNYLGLATETVNPADGSLTFELPLPLPPGRGISMPFSIHYNSGLSYYLSSYIGTTSTFPNLNWIPNPASAAPFSVPFLSFQAAIRYPIYTTTDGINFTLHQCDWTTGFVFRGLDGVQYPLGPVGENWSDESPEPGDPEDTSCPYVPAPGGTYHGILVAPGAQSTNQDYGQPPMTLTDVSGTTYTFAAMPIGHISGAAPFIEPEILYPQTITDRNGNQLTFTVQGNNSWKYTDALGRPAVSWTASQSGSAISVYGFGNVTINQTMSSANLSLPGGIEDLTHNTQACVKNTAQPYAKPYVASSVIGLPDGTSYTIQFDPSFGQVQKITYPGGGTVTYTWGLNSNAGNSNASYTLFNKGTTTMETCNFQFDIPAITERDVSFDGVTTALTQTFSYSQTPSTGAWTSKTTTVKTVDEIAGTTTYTNYTYGPITPDIYNSSSWIVGGAPVERSIVDEDASHTVLRTVNKTWGDVRHIIGEQTVFASGQGSAKEYCYDANEQLVGSYEYGFQSEGSNPGDPSCYTSALKTGSGQQGDPGLKTSQYGPLQRYTATAIHTFPATPPTHIVNEPDSVTVYDGSNTKWKQSTFSYDGTAIASSPTATATGLVSPPGSRGNATTITQWLSSGTSPAVNYTYYANGQLATMTDACGAATCADITGSQHTTTYTYTDSPAGGNSFGNSNAFLTKISDPLGHLRAYTYNYSAGTMASSTNEFTTGTQELTKYYYGTKAPQCSAADALGRLTEVDYPNSGVTSYCYNDAVPSITTNQLLGNSTWKTTLATQDSFGHVISTQLTSDPSNADIVTTQYDGHGRVYTKTNPYRTTSSPGYGVTTYAYDAMSRPVSVQNPDQTFRYWCYDDIASASQDNCKAHAANVTGEWVDYADENGNDWQRTTDSLGRLTNVIEPGGAATYYSYNILEDLLCAAQDGGAGGKFSSCASAPTSWRPRTFSYDSLSRLIQAFNPEGGWTCYGSTGGAAPTGSNCTSGYDANGNLAFKTDARNVTTAYSYDALNRLLSKRFSGDPAATPSSCYQYDSATLGVGRLGAEWTQSAGAGACAASVPTSGVWSTRTILSYNEVGLVLSEKQCTPSNCNGGTSYSPSYTFDPAGNQATATNGITSTPTVGTITLTNAMDGAGRLLSINSSWNDPTHPASLFSAQTGNSPPCAHTTSSPYTAFGVLTNALYGGNLALNRGYDSRMHVTCETDTGSVTGSSTNASATATVTGMEQSQ